MSPRTTPKSGFLLVADPTSAATMLTELRAGTGAFAIDTERASGYRYSNRAYLIQVRRADTQTFLIDPQAVPEALEELAETLGTEAWILHAASQDLPCLTELGLYPPALFDTELAGRLLGFPKVALGSLTEELLGVTLAKEHSRVDWSIRPLRPEWLAYAALDVDLLHELAEILSAELVAAGKDEWLRQECAHLVATAGQPPEPRTDPWRRTSGISQVRSREGLAAVRALWHTRDEIAQRLDKAPGRILSDQAISATAALITAENRVLTRAEFRRCEQSRYRMAARFENSWLQAISAAADLPPAELPPLRLPATEPPPVRYWADHDEEAAQWWASYREPLLARAEELAIPVENLVTPSVFRLLGWERPADIEGFLVEHGVRPWQREILQDVLAEAELAVSEPDQPRPQP